MTNLSKLSGSLPKIVAISAEPGGAEAVKKRLEEHGVPTSGLEFRSDPEHKEVIAEAGDVYTFKLKEADFGNYDMYQPTLVVVSEGHVLKELTWSWKTMGYPEGTEMTKIKMESCMPPYSIVLVQVRPVIEDIGDAIKEKRAVELAAAKVAFPLSIAFSIINCVK